MLTCYSVVKNLKLRLLFIFVSELIIKCDEINYCPFVETVSFESDIDIKCNNTYLIFNEINNKELNWKFANQSLFCHQKGKQQGFVNQCGITRIDSKYLKVPLISVDPNRMEHACVYCPINYKPIAPIISVTRSDDAQQSSYIFNITANGLDDSESFEILWARRVSRSVQNSVNYWFFQRCIHSYIHYFDNNGHTIIFATDDIYISRVEFIIRRCSDFCQNYQICDEKELSDEMFLNNLHVPDSIEKISCDYNCLNGIVSTTTTMNNIIKEDTLSSTIQLSNKKRTIKFLIIFPILGLLIVLLFIILGCFIISRKKGSRTGNVYKKTSNINLDENKRTVK